MIPGLWIKAAKWEFEQNANISAARVLLQRSLRLMAHQPDLWTEYFRLEWLYLEKMTKRMQVLKIDPRTVQPRSNPIEGSESSSEDEDASDEDDSDQEAEKKPRRGRAVELPQLSVEADKAEEQAILDPFLRGDILRVIVRNAKSAIPNNVGFMLSLLPICRLFSNSLPCRDDIYLLLGDSDEAIAARCRRPLEDQLAGSLSLLSFLHFSSASFLFLLLPSLDTLPISPY
eukprot:m.710485 g.710485  ORF g.710485 m.710485 type:complete len:230 (-) comp58760_c0_seq6:25-714(-)